MRTRLAWLLGLLVAGGGLAAWSVLHGQGPADVARSSASAQVHAR